VNGAFQPGDLRILFLAGVANGLGLVLLAATADGSLSLESFVAFLTDRHP